ncbi:hypothetical protein DYI25_14045 [Mesobacillus boroniphilus]|uniref:BON domain-containing protein n=1 Tax=Mesobacillus boroniphilus TaxID=308892 RepID=A0A944CM49_9BACI|nr:hypothetical protein [Mesobacillus boroniphilus]MBS8265545.1 hypothetical protein [Mesobacillus boroniphilus]
MKKLLMLLVLAMVIVSGCGQDNTDSVYDKNEDQAGVDLNREDDGVREGDGPNFTRDLDDGMTMTDQNPNLLNTDNENHYSFSQDVQKAKDVISDAGYEPGSIWINGGKMNVTAQLQGRVTRKDRENAQKTLQEKLTRALPRYDVNVDIE